MAADCSPCYTGRPNFIIGVQETNLPHHNITRSRLFAGGTYFRSNLQTGGLTDQQGADANEIAIAIEQTEDALLTLRVYFKDVEVESYAVTQVENCGDEEEEGAGAGGGGDGGSNYIGVDIAIPALRTLTLSSQYIIMPDRGTDPNDPDDPGEGGEQSTPPLDDMCLSAVPKTSFSGGIGASTAQSALDAIRTGPERTLQYLKTIEDEFGVPYRPNSPSNLQEFNYDTREWQNYIPGNDCRPEGTACEP